MRMIALAKLDCFSKQRKELKFLLAEQCIRHIINNHSSATEEPCISNGGSPFRFKDFPRITDAIFTEPYSHLYRYCGMTSQKSMSDIGNVRHRVDNLSTKNSSKAYRVALLPPSFLCLENFRHSMISQWSHFIRKEAAYV